MNELIFGPDSYAESVQRVSDRLAYEKRTWHLQTAMSVALEGLSNTGKSTLARRLEEKLRGDCLNVVHLEGDLFQKSREESMLMYCQLLEEVEKGASVPDDFPSRVWNYDKMKMELLIPLRSFQQDNEERGRIVLKDVLNEKKTGTEHTETYDIDRNTLILTSGIYLRHLPEFNFVLFLDADFEVIVQRKLDRTTKLGVVRDPSLTRKMVKLLELPVMKKHLANSRIPEGIVLDVTDFEKIRGFNIAGYTSPHII